jgi:hypothetical protein
VAQLDCYPMCEVFPSSLLDILWKDASIELGLSFGTLNLASNISHLLVRSWTTFSRFAKVPWYTALEGA